MTTDRRRSTVFVMVATVFAMPTSFAQEPSKSAERPTQMTAEQKAEMEAYVRAGTPGDPHRKLAETVGKYRVKIRSWHEPGGPAMEETGTATRTMALDGRVLVEQFSGKMMGAPFDGHAMTGYDNTLGQYWSTWNDSMSTGIVLSRGSCDSKGTCTFRGSWVDPLTKAQADSRMTSRRPDADTEIFEMYGPDRQGREMKMLELTYERM